MRPMSWGSAPARSCEFSGCLGVGRWLHVFDHNINIHIYTYTYIYIYIYIQIALV